MSRPCDPFGSEALVWRGPMAGRKPGQGRGERPSAVGSSGVVDTPDVAGPESVGRVEPEGAAEPEGVVEPAAPAAFDAPVEEGAADWILGANSGVIRRICMP